jgi:hypothetical protein
MEGGTMSGRVSANHFQGVYVSCCLLLVNDVSIA